MTTAATPEWYDESRLRKAEYAPGYTGWVIDCGDGTCRFANSPLLGCDDENNPNRDAINAAAPQWGDRVRLIETTDGLPRGEATEIIERCPIEATT